MAKHYIEQLKGRWGLLLLAVLGLFLLLYGGMGGDGESQSSASDDYFSEAESYRLSLEARLEELCASVAGVASPDVFITLASGEVSEYAESESGRYVVSGGDGLLVARRMPPVSGVAVVCTGGDDPSVKRELVMLIAAALNIGSNCIYVSGR